MRRAGQGREPDGHGAARAGMVARRPPTILGLLIVAAACGSPTNPSQPPPPPAVPLQRFIALSGDGQEGVPGSTLPAPFVVEVSQSGVGLGGVLVNWSVDSGTGTLSSETTVTDAQGRAAVSFTPSVHRTTVSATVAAPNGARVRFRTFPGLMAAYLRVRPVCQGECEWLTFSLDSTFAYVYLSYSFTGHFSRTDSILALVFDANYPRWQATGVIRADSLVVSYNPDMQLSDFTNASFLGQSGALAPLGCEPGCARTIAK